MPEANVMEIAAAVNDAYDFDEPYTPEMGDLLDWLYEDDSEEVAA